MKLPFSFSLKFVFRLIFPGFILSIALFPLFRGLCDSLEVDIGTREMLILSTILAGWLFLVLDMHIYMMLEGRRYWPNWLRRVFVNFERKRLERLLSAYNENKNKNRARHVELSVELRRFPMDKEGNRTVVYPTRLGNLLTAYEDYPLRSYGMDSVFYWYRIWVAVDEELREHIDNQQALSDSSVYVVASLFLSGLTTLGYACTKALGVGFLSQLPDTGVLVVFGLSALVAANFLYRASLHIQASFGELYKSMFDIYRDKVPVDEVIEIISSLPRDAEIKFTNRRDKNIAAWRYLHNYKIKTDRGMVSAAKYVEEE